MRLTALDAPTMTTTAKAGNIHPRSISRLLKKGTARVVLRDPGSRRMIHRLAATAMTACNPSFSLDDRPTLLRCITFR